MGIFHSESELAWDSPFTNEGSKPPISYLSENPQWFGAFIGSKSHVVIEQPVMPWEDVDWLAFRNAMVHSHFKWMEDQGWIFKNDFWYFYDKSEHAVVYLFENPSKAVLFKLAMGGRR